MPDRRKLRPRKEPSQERSRQTVEAILQATAYILVAGGYPALTTNRVAERAGVNIATLYQYFPSKEAIFAELLRRHVAETRAAALAVLVSKRGRGLEATARAMVEAGIAAHRITPALHRIFTEEAPRLGLGPIDAPTDVEMEREAQAWLELPCGRLEEWRHRLAGPAPGGPKIHDQRRLVASHVTIEVTRRERHRPPFEQLEMALRAAGMVAKARRRQGDDAITMPANDLQLFFHSGYDRRHLRKLRKNGAHTKNDAVRGGPVNCHFSLALWRTWLRIWTRCRTSRQRPETPPRGSRAPLRYDRANADRLPGKSRDPHRRGDAQPSCLSAICRPYMGKSRRAKRISSRSHGI